MTHAENLKHFEGPNAENDAWFGRLSPKDQQAKVEFVSRANMAFDYVKRNGFPESYIDSAKIYNDIAKANAAGPINLEDLYALDTAINETVWATDTFSKIGIPTTVMQKPRFEIKDYLVQSEEIPRFTTNFRNPQFMRLKESSQFSNGVGLNIGISIPFTQIVESQGALWSPQAILMQEAAAKFGIYKNRRGWLGTACYNAIADDGNTPASWGITGLFNYASNQTFASGIGGDENVQDQGDIEFSLRTAIADLKLVRKPGKIVVVSTGGYASHLFTERDTYTQTLDYDRVKNFKKDSGFGLVDEWWVTEDLYAAAPAAAHQKIMVMKLTDDIHRHIIYPQQTLPMANKTYEKDIQENMIFADIIQIKKIDTTYNAIPITINNADCTADGTGFIPEGTRIL